MDVFFVLYAGALPAVPLLGAEIFKRRQDDRRRNICYALTVLQALASISYIFAYFSG